MTRAIITGVITLLSALTLTVVSAWLITRAWQQPSVMDLTVAITAVRALGISRSLFRYVDRLAGHHVALSRAADARTDVYRRLAGAPTKQVVGMSRGSLLARIGGDVDAIADRIVRSTIPRWVAAVTSALAVVFLLLLSPVAAVVLAVGLLVSGVIAPILAGRAERAALTAEDSENYLSSVDHVLNSAPTLRTRGQLAEALQRAESAEASVRMTRRQGLPWAARGDGLWTLSSMLTVAFVVWSAASAAPAHSPQWFVVVALLPLSAFEAVSVLPDATRARIRARHSSDRLSEIPQSTSDSQSVSPAVSAATATPSAAEVSGVVADNLTVGWDEPVASYSFTVPAGGRREIVAPSGTGKTTLLMTLAGLLPAKDGYFAAPGARFIAEDEHIFATTVRDNLAVGEPTATDEQMREVLSALGLMEWVDGLPKGLGTVLRRGDEDLSGGQRRRLILARALLTDAPTLLLDEPTEHLDEVSTRETLQLLGFDSAGQRGTSGYRLPGARASRTIIMVRHPR